MFACLVHFVLADVNAVLCNPHHRATQNLRICKEICDANFFGVHPNMAQLLCTGLKHDCFSSPFPHWPALTLLCPHKVMELKAGRGVSGAVFSVGDGSFCWCGLWPFYLSRSFTCTWTYVKHWRKWGGGGKHQFSTSKAKITNESPPSPVSNTGNSQQLCNKPGTWLTSFLTV